jgi:thymidylate kinase
LINQLGEEWFRQIVAWHYRRRGYVVLFDRHFFFDYYAHDIANGGQHRRIASQIHGFLLKHFYPQPDLVVFLDAPAEVLFARKGEGTIGFLEHRRQEYLQLRQHVRNFFVVDATRPLDDVTRDVIALIQNFRQARSNRQCEVQDGRS